MSTQDEASAVEADDLPAPPRCPFIASADAAWVTDAAHPEHRCGAVRPPALLAVAKQRRLCLTTSHTDCATYIAAGEARDVIVGAGAEQGAWGWVRTTPVVDVNVGRGAMLASLMTDRRGWQVVPAIALVAALGALGLSNLGSGGSPRGSTPIATFAALTSPTVAPPTATPSVSEAATAGPSVEPTSQPSSMPSATPSQVPSPTPVHSATTSYTVKSGDTLYDIAIKFNTTVTSIKNLNSLTSTTLHVGQVLLIP